MEQASNTKVANSIERLSFLTILATLFALPLVTFHGIVDAYELPKYTLLAAAALFVAFLWLSRVAISGKVTFSRHPANFFILGLFLIWLISTITSVRPATSLWGYPLRHEGLLTTSFYLMIWFFVSNLDLDEKRLYSLLLSLVSSSTLVALIGILKYSGFSLGTTLYGWTADPRQVSSTLGNPNFLGAYLVITALITLGVALAFRKKPVFPGWSGPLVLFCFTSFVLQVVCLYFTFSRGAWLGLLAGLLLLAFSKREEIIRIKDWPQVLVSSTLLAVTILALIYLGNYIHIQKFRTSYTAIDRLAGAVDLRSGTTAERLAFWSIALSMIRNNPVIGVGPDAYALAFPRYRPDDFDRLLPKRKNMVPDRPHNDFLQVASALGVFGLLFYLSILITAFSAVFKRLQKEQRLESGFLLTGLLAGLFGYIAQNVFNFHTVATGFVFWFAIGLLTNLTQDQRPARLELKSWSYAPLSIKTLLVLCLFGLAALAAYRTALIPFISHRHAMQSVIYNREDLFDAAESEAKKAIEFAPSEESYYLYLGDVYRRRYEIEKDPRYFALATDSYEQAVKVNPLERYTRFRLGVYYLKHFELYGEAKSAKRSVAVFKDLVKLEPNYAQSHYNLGVAYFYLKKYALAIREFEETLRLDPAESDAYFLTGKIYQQEGETAKARRYYQKTITLDPANRKVKQALKELENQGIEDAD